MKNQAEAGGNEKLSSKLKNMVKLFPVPNSMMALKLKSDTFTGKNKSNSEDYTTFDINGLNHKPIEECDHLFEDCLKFLKVSKETIQFATESSNPTKPTLTGLNLTSKINKFRAKRKGNHLYLMFEALQERIEFIESQLKTLNDESQRNSTSLILQSLHLKSRLTACIEYNKAETEHLKPVITEAKRLFEILRQSETAVQSMLTFFDEVASLARNQPYVPWALRGSSETTGVPTTDHKVSRKALLKRCNKLAKVRLVVEQNLDVISRRHDVHQSNYSHCSRVLQSMNKLLYKISAQNYAASKKGGPDPIVVTNNPITSSTSPISPLAAAFSKILTAPPVIQEPSVVTIPSADTSGYTDALLSKYAASAHIEKEDVLRLSDSSTGRVSLDNTALHQPRSQTSSDCDDVVSSHPLVVVSDIAANNNSDVDSEKVRAQEDELRQKELREEQFIRDYLGDVYEENETYDHAHCSDCSCVYSMANECLMHLAASQHQAQECQARMKKLQHDFKNRVKEDAERLDALDWGGHNHVHLA